MQQFIAHVHRTVSHAQMPIVSCDHTHKRGKQPLVGQEFIYPLRRLTKQLLWFHS